MVRRFPTTLAATVFAVAAIVVGLLLLAQKPAPARFDCRADRRSLEIAIASYRARFGQTTEPTRAELKAAGLVDRVDKAYTYTFTDGRATFRPVTGTGCP